VGADLGQDPGVVGVELVALFGREQVGQENTLFMVSILVG
jgi:hypothetical protein